MAKFYQFHWQPTLYPLAQVFFSTVLTEGRIYSNLEIELSEKSDYKISISSNNVLCNEH